MVKDLLVDHGSLKQYQKSSSDAPLPLIRSALVYILWSIEYVGAIIINELNGGQYSRANKYKIAYGPYT